MLSQHGERWAVRFTLSEERFVRDGIRLVLSLSEGHVSTAPAAASSTLTSSRVQLDMVTLFTRCENDWCADLQRSQTKLLHGAITTAPNPNCDSLPQSGQLKGVWFFFFEDRR